MPRLFHLSCSGFIDGRRDYSRDILVRATEILGSTHLSRQALGATAEAPLLLRSSEGTLSTTRALDAELMKIGLVSLVCFSESEAPQERRIFLDQRSGPRRSDLVGFPGAQNASASPNQRASRGRRSLDQL